MLTAEIYTEDKRVTDLWLAFFQPFYPSTKVQ